MNNTNGDTADWMTPESKTIRGSQTAPFNKARLVRYCLSHPEYIEDLDTAWFKDMPDLQYIVKLLKAAVQARYKDINSSDIEVMAETDGHDPSFYRTYFEDIQALEDPQGAVADKVVADITWLKLRTAMVEVVSLMTTTKSSKEYAKVAAKCRDLINGSQISAAGESPSMDFFDINAHRPDDGCYIPSLWSMLPKGMEVGTLNCYLGEANIGKSIFLCNEAVHGAINGENVLFASFEMSERRVAARIATNLLDINDLEYTGLLSNDRDELEARLKAVSHRYPGIGKIIIKQFPTSAASVDDIRREIRKMRDAGFPPRKVVVDYLGIIAPLNRKITDLYEKHKYVAEELRALAIEEKVCVVTAAQINRSGFGMDDFGFEAVAECAAILHTCDSILAITQTEDYRVANMYRLKALKIRDGAGKGMFTNVIVDYNKMRLTEDLSAAEQCRRQLEQENRFTTGSMPSELSNEAALETLKGMTSVEYEHEEETEIVDDTGSVDDSTLDYFSTVMQKGYEERHTDHDYDHG